MIGEGKPVIQHHQHKKIIKLAFTLFRRFLELEQFKANKVTFSLALYLYLLNR